MARTETQSGRAVRPGYQGHRQQVDCPLMETVPETTTSIIGLLEL